MEHTIAKTILITKITELISSEYKISVEEARDELYSSKLITLINDDETGLYGESPLYNFSLFQSYRKLKNNHISKR